MRPEIGMGRLIRWLDEAQRPMPNLLTARRPCLHHCDLGFRHRHRYVAAHARRKTGTNTADSASKSRLVDRRTHIQRGVEIFSGHDNSGFIIEPADETRQTRPVSTPNKLCFSRGGRERWNATLWGQGSRCGGPWTAYLNSVPGPHSPDFEWQSGGGRNDLPGSWGNLGAAWPFMRRDLAWP